MGQPEFGAVDANLLSFFYGSFICKIDLNFSILTSLLIDIILSIDSATSEVSSIKLNVKSKKNEVIEFLTDLQNTLVDKDFNIDKDFTIIKTKKISGKEQFSTPYTMLDLEYDAYDIVEKLKELTVGEYSETLIDIDDNNPPLLFVFGKAINGKLVYIKLKLKDYKRRHVLCVSFHYAENNMIFPYA